MDWWRVGGLNKFEFKIASHKFIYSTYRLGCSDPTEVLACTHRDDKEKTCLDIAPFFRGGCRRAGRNKMVTRH